MSLLAVFGMHRSGTSLVAEMLHRLAWDVGDPDDLMPPKPDNPRGFVEHLPAVRINDRLLHRLGGTWRRPPVLPTGWAHDPALDDLRDEATAVAEALTGGDHDRVLFKDPRLSLTLPFWRTVTTVDAGVLVLRPPAAVIRSLLKRHDDMPTAEAADLYVTYTLHALSHDLQVEVVDADALLADPAAQLERLSSALGHTPTAADVEEAVGAFAPGLWGRGADVDDGPDADDLHVATALAVHRCVVGDTGEEWRPILGRLRLAGTVDQALARGADERERLAAAAETAREGRLRAVADRDRARSHARTLQERIEAERRKQRDLHHEMQGRIDEVEETSRSTIEALRLQLEQAGRGRWRRR